MDLALKLARLGMHGVGANPMVGCVIEKNGKIITQGIIKFLVMLTLKLTPWIKSIIKLMMLRYMSH